MHRRKSKDVLSINNTLLYDSDKNVCKISNFVTVIINNIPYVCAADLYFFSEYNFLEILCVIISS